MASSVRPRQNHYDTLGLSPTASQDEITRAFAKMMSMTGARSVAAAAQMGVAFEVLRNPAKRRAYDSALGLRPDQPRLAVAGIARTSPGFLGSDWGRLAEQVTGAGLKRTADPGQPPPQLQPIQRTASPAQPTAKLQPAPLQRAVGPARSPAAPRPAAPADSKLASFIASSVREPRAPGRRNEDVNASRQAEPAQNNINRPRPPAERERKQPFAIRQADPWPGVEERPLDWRRPALVVGGFVAAAALVGAFAGISLKDDEQPSPQRGASAIHPGRIARQASANASSATVPAPAAPTISPVAKPVEGPQPRPLPAGIRAPLTRHRSFSQQPSSWAQRQVEQSQVADAALQDQRVANAGDQAPVEAAAAQPIAANLPLPREVIARTIERIGYSCGTVVGAAAAEGAGPGAYTVTCSSGQTYDARPVHGRYRFRRSGRN